MPRGRPRARLDANALERELEDLKRKQAELRKQLRGFRSSATTVRKLQGKLDKQLAGAKWTVKLIHELQPDWDDVGFYRTVRPKQPTPRGRRPRVAKGAA